MPTKNLMSSLRFFRPRSDSCKTENLAERTGLRFVAGNVIGKISIALATCGKLQQAHDIFQKAISYRNDVRLMSEELDPENGGFLGNFPQGFTHLALIGAAVNLAKAEKHGPEEHPQTEAQRADKAKKSVD
jgi:hypothetical protein